MPPEVSDQQPSNLLPIVKQGIGPSVRQKILGKSDEYVEDYLDELQKTNPGIANLIRGFSKDKENEMGIKWCGVLVYEVLRSQAECDWMEKSIKL